MRYATLDLSGPYRSVFSNTVPQATQVADPFHLIKMTTRDESRPGCFVVRSRGPDMNDVRSTSSHLAHRCPCGPGILSQPDFCDRSPGLLYMPRGGASKNRTYDLVIISDAL